MIPRPQSKLINDHTDYIKPITSIARSTRPNLIDSGDVEIDARVENEHKSAALATENAVQ